MDVEEQRRLGVRLAKEGDAPKTLEAVKNLDSTLEDILNIAVNEIGLDKLMSYLEEVPVWAHAALLYLPNLGNHEEALIKTSSSLHTTMVELSSTNSSEALLDESMEPVGTLGLDLISGAAFVGAFTMFWQNPSQPGITQPYAGTRNSRAWRWSKNLTVGPAFAQAMMNCSEFALQDSPLDAGATVWLVMRTGCRDYHATTWRFKYQPGGPTRTIKTLGLAGYPNFSYP